MTKRGATPRRLAAAERALQRERDRHPLFAAEIAADQETAEERIEAFDEGSIEFWRAQRDLAAKHWLDGRRVLRAMPHEMQTRCLVAWNSCGLPGDAGYFVRFVKGWPLRWEELNKPLTDLQVAVLARLGREWTPANEFTDVERMTVHDLMTRGLAEKRYGKTWIEFRRAVCK